MNILYPCRKHIVLTLELLSLLCLITLSALLIPGDCIMMSLGCAVAYSIPRFIYSRSSIRSTLGTLSLLGISMVMMVGAIINIWQFTDLLGGTMQSPVLINIDSARYYEAALHLLHGYDELSSVAYIGYPLIISLIWKLTGVNMIVPIVINILFTLVSIVLSAFISVRLIGDNQNKRYIANLAIFLTGICCYYIGCGMVILKDPSIYLGVALCAYSLIPVYKDKMRCADFAFFLLGVILLALNRVTIIYPIAFGLILFTVFNRQRVIWHSALLLLMLFVGCVAGSFFASYGIAFHAQMIDGAAIGHEYITTPQQQPLTAIIGDYFSYPAWKKILLLPITAATQYFIPFPWNFMRDTSFGYSQILSHFAYPWYLIGGILIFYYLFLWLRKKDDNNLSWWALWALVCYLIPAFIFAGSVSRYFLPFIPLSIPLVITVIMKLKDKILRKQFKIFAGVYIAIVLVTLIVCYNLQTALS